MSDTLPDGYTAAQCAERIEIAYPAAPRLVAQARKSGMDRAEYLAWFRGMFPGEFDAALVEGLGYLWDEGAHYEWAIQNGLARSEVA